VIIKAASLVGVLGSFRLQVARSTFPSASQATTTTRMPAATADGRVGAVRGDRDEAYVALCVAARGVVRVDAQQPRVFALGAGVGHQRDAGKAGDLRRAAPTATRSARRSL
jgi:hypothetical protein